LSVNFAFALSAHTTAGYHTGGCRPSFVSVQCGTHKPHFGQILCFIWLGQGTDNNGFHWQYLGTGEAEWMKLPKLWQNKSNSSELDWQPNPYTSLTICQLTWIVWRFVGRM